MAHGRVWSVNVMWGFSPERKEKINQVERQVWLLQCNEWRKRIRKSRRRVKTPMRKTMTKIKLVIGK